jgi:hypothetical protein
MLTSRSKVEGAHAAAALALSLSADPGGVGVWGRATPHVLYALPLHYMYSRQWQLLAGRGLGFS